MPNRPLFKSEPYISTQKGPFPEIRNGSKCKYLCFTFRGKNNVKYIFRAEYEDKNPNLYILKFYEARSKHSKNKYSRLTKVNDTYKMISTFIDIIWKIALINEKASFAFVGAPLAGETSHPNKRYRVWLKALQRILLWPHYGTVDSPHNSRALFFSTKCEPAEVERMKTALTKLPT